MLDAELLEALDGTVAVAHSANLFSAVERHQEGRLAFTDHATLRSMTFGGLRDAARRSALRLQQLQVQRGDVVAFFAEGSGLDLMPMLLACAGLGVRLLASDAALPRSAALTVVEQCRPKLVHRPEGAHQGWGLEKGEARLITHGEWRRRRVRRDTGSDRRISGPDLQDEPCLIVYTSGTTAPPKPVLLTPAGLLEMARAFRGAYPVTGEDTFFAASPLATANGIGISGVIPMLAGAHVVLASRSILADPEMYWAAVDQADATICELPASRIPLLLDADGPTRTVPRRLRFVLSSGGRLPDARRQAAEALWGRRVYQGYGTAETGYWTACTPYGSSGGGTLKPLNGTDILIRPLRAPPSLLSGVHPSDHEDAAPDEAGPAIGEILVRGAAVTPGYHRKTGSTHTAFEGGYFRTGDIGSLDRDGGLRVLGRCKDFVVRKGRGVLLSDIDAVLAQHPAIIECKTVADRNSGGGQRITSVCVASEPALDLHAWLAERVGAAWLPDQVVFAAALPRGPGGEISTDLLQSIAGNRLQDEIVGALTARKFRRNPPHKEGALRELVQEAILGHGPLRFFTFWGCGPRRTADEPEIAALAALGELLDAARPAPWMRAEVSIIFTDAHATANGHSQDHSSSYFGGGRTGSTRVGRIVHTRVAGVGVARPDGGSGAPIRGNGGA